MNTRQLVEDETERGTPEAPWRSQKRKRTSSWYQRPPDAITSRVWSVVNRPLVQPLSLPYVTASRRSLSLSLFSSSRSSSFYLPSESPSRSVCLPSPAKFRQLPPRHLVFLSKVHSSRRVCRIKGEGGGRLLEISSVKLPKSNWMGRNWSQPDDDRSNSWRGRQFMGVDVIVVDEGREFEFPWRRWPTMFLLCFLFRCFIYILH